MSERVLPEGWVSTTLGELCELNLKQKLDDELEVGFMPMSGVPTTFHDKPKFETRKWEAVKKGYTQFKDGDVLFAKITPCFENGKATVVEGFPCGWGAGSTEYHVLRPRAEAVDPRLLLALVRTKDFLNNGELNMSGSVGHKRVPKEFVAGYSFPLMSAEEQKIIAEQLDSLLAQVNNLKARLEAISAILKRFRKSVLKAAVSGKLTESWRDDDGISEDASSLKKRWLEERRSDFYKLQQQLVDCGKQRGLKKFKEPVAADVDMLSIDLPKGWCAVSVSEYAECLDNYRVPVKKERRAGSEKLYPYFGANGEVDRVDEYIFDDDLVMVTEDETFYGREKPIAYRYTGKCWVNNHVHVLRAPTKQANDYLCYSLMYYNVLPWLSGTTGRAKLTQAALNSMPITLPPEEELNEIVHRVDQLFAFADQVEQQVANAQARVDKLTQSILAKAFRGELTAEWRAENPELISGEHSAEALLERIKAEKAKQKPAKTRRGGRKVTVTS